MFKCEGEKFALLLGNTYKNTLKSCENDLYILEKSLKNMNFKIKIKIDSHLEKELEEFISETNFKENDLLFIHFSGHGKLYGKKINKKVHLISSWINEDGSLFYSDILDSILSKIKVKK